MKRLLLFACIIISVPGSNYAQNSSSKGYSVIQKGSENESAFINFNGNTLNPDNVWANIKPELGLAADDDMRFYRKSKKDKLGFVTLRYQQFYKGVEVWGSEFLLHEKAGVLVSANGRVIGNLNLSVSPAIAEEAGLAFALKTIGEKQYRWQDENGNTVNPKYLPKGKLIIASDDVSKSESTDYHLCWAFTIAGNELNKGWSVFVDAQTGTVINKFSIICDLGNVQGSTKTYYHGTQNITCFNDTNSSGTQQYSLFQKISQPLGNTDVAVYDYQNNSKIGSAKVDTSKFKKVISDTSFFANDSISGEIYFGLENTHAYYDSIFQRNSIDDRGLKISGLSHYGDKYANANWSAIDSLMLYGDGDAVQLRPVVGIDITGHELTHGVTQFSAGLIYQAEPGALNESFSDILGTGVEFFALGNKANWTIGEGVLITAPGYLRNMSNPKLGYTPQPNTYKGKNWVSTNGGCNIFNDQCGLHTNSGIQNLWFYLLSQGGTGTNDNKLIYNVAGIGIKKAEQIAYRNLTNYIISSSKYMDARIGSIKAAEDLYGVNSPEVKSVKDAWCAVGVCEVVPTSIADINTNSQNVNVYPNPAKDILNLRFSYKEPANYVLYNYNGALVKSGIVLPNTVNSISTDHLAAGVYALHILSANGDWTITKKIVLDN